MLVYHGWGGAPLGVRLICCLPRWACSSNARQWSSSQALTKPTDKQLGVPLDAPSYLVWGANTGIGKTLVSVGLAHAAKRLQVPFLYLKPVQTGFPADSDARLVALASGALLQLGAHAAHQAGVAPTDTCTASPDGSAGGAGAAGVAGRAEAAPLQVARVEHAWGTPVSPHLAVQHEGRPVADEALRAGVGRQMRAFHAQLRGGAGRGGGARRAAGSVLQEEQLQRLAARGVVLVESAGGVASPSPSGRLMCDTLRPLRLPTILVGDPRLGGISSTISAYESLLLRGYDTDVILFMDQPSTAPAPSPPADAGAVHAAHAADPQPSCAAPDPCMHGGTNAAALQAHLTHQFHSMGRPGPRVMSIPACPPPPPAVSSPTPPTAAQGVDAGSGGAAAAATAAADASLPGAAGTGLDGGGIDASLAAWLQDTAPHFDALIGYLSDSHAARMAYLHSMKGRATSALWWPFTQHQTLHTEGIQVVDSRWGDSWLALSGDSSSSSGSDSGSRAHSSSLVPLHDACSSWWTQAATLEHHPELSRAVAYATGRYLHIMFPENVHQAALEAAERLLQVVGGSWAKRVFFSDDGSTAVEVALKMAFRAFMRQHHLDLGQRSGSSSSPMELQVVGLANAYHGDTLGAMDCVPPSPFNGPGQAPWYRGRGLFFEPPYVAMEAGAWQVVQPQPPWWAGHMGSHAHTHAWSTLHEVLSPSRDGSDVTKSYRQYIEQRLDEHERQQAATPAGSGQAGARLAALVMEPLVQGAGGMLMVDPQFQRELVHACRARGMVVIFDEVMTGGFRLGAPTAASLLCLQPDIACFAKLVTGGALPMAATLTTEDVFKAFEGDSKMQALLHGHSYTAYPAGCAAIVAALNMLTNPAHNPNLISPHPPAGPVPQPRALDAGLAGEQVVVPPCTPSSGQAAAGTHKGHCCHPTHVGFVGQQQQQQSRAVVGSKYCRQAAALAAGTPTCGEPLMLAPMWCENAVAALSHHPAVARLVAIGTLLAVQVRTQQHASSTSINNYGSAAGAALHVATLLRKTHSIFARPLGDVVYVMVPPTTLKTTCDQLVAGMTASLDEHLRGFTSSRMDLRDGYIV